MRKQVLLFGLFILNISLFSQSNIAAGEVINFNEDNNYCSIEFSYFNFFDGDKEIKELNTAINNFFETYKKEFRGLIDEDIKFEMDSGFIAGKYATTVTTRYFILKSGIISVFFDVSYYTLGAHGNINFISYHYDTKTDKFVDIGTIANIKGQDDLDRFNDLLKRYFINTDGCFDITPNIETIDYNMFYVDNEYITVVFPPYTLGSYSCGVAEIKIPLNDLSK